VHYWWFHAREQRAAAEARKREAAQRRAEAQVALRSQVALRAQAAAEAAMPDVMAADMNALAIAVEQPPAAPLAPRHRPLQRRAPQDNVLLVLEPPA
jgi:hypothetical protein